MGRGACPACLRRLPFLPEAPALPAACPATTQAFLITTGDHDDRVVPLHSHKLTATLQQALAGSPDSPQRNP